MPFGTQSLSLFLPDNIQPTAVSSRTLSEVLCLYTLICLQPLQPMSHSSHLLIGLLLSIGVSVIGYFTHVRVELAEGKGQATSLSVPGSTVIHQLWSGTGRATTALSKALCQAPFQPPSILLHPLKCACVSVWVGGCVCMRMGGWVCTAVIAQKIPPSDLSERWNTKLTCSILWTQGLLFLLCLYGYRLPSASHPPTHRLALLYFDYIRNALSSTLDGFMIIVLFVLFWIWRR